MYHDDFTSTLSNTYEHTMHGLLVGVGLYATGIASMRTAAMVGAGAAAYMLTFGHELPFSM